MKTVLLITNIISPYRIPLFNKISEDMKKKGTQFVVFFMADRDSIREWDIEYRNICFEYRILNGKKFYFKKLDWGLYLNTGVIKSIRGVKPDLIIASYDNLTYWFAFFYSKIMRCKFSIWSGSHLLSSEVTKGIIGFLKRIIIKNSHSYVTYGTKAAEYLVHFGADSSKIFIGKNTVDTNYYKTEVINYRSTNEFNIERAKYPKVMLLYVGTIYQRKNVLIILKALKHVSNDDIGLFIVGEGDQRSEMELFCKENNIRNVFFEGYKQRHQIVKYYALADVLILPSFKEVWGLVVNEGLSCGLYILASKSIGAYYDLIKENFNGNGFMPDDEGELAKSIKQIYKRIDAIKRDDIINECNQNNTIDVYADAFIKCIEKTLED